LEVLEKVVFTKSLMSATIQDSGKRERSNDYMLLLCPKNKRKIKLKKIDKKKRK